MKRTLLFFLLALQTAIFAAAQDTKTIDISTNDTQLLLCVDGSGRLRQAYYGDRLNDAQAATLLAARANRSARHEVYAGSGGEDYFEPGVAFTHADGNPTTILVYQTHEQHPIEGGTETVVTLTDTVYPVTVQLHYAAYEKENVIKAWTEITHAEKRPITLWRYASCMLYFDAGKYFLTSYHSDWAKEGQPETTQLTFGKKVIDTKLGTRAAMHAEPVFELGIGAPAREDEGRVVLGHIAWTGNFSLLFEVDNLGVLRLIPGINPYASDYLLRPKTQFRTPDFIFTTSAHGTGEASRRMHDWARRYQVKDGNGDRMSLLNNWESTGFNFTQQSLAELMKQAKALDLDMFLLDDGWFANKYPRNDDRAGLGDWENNRTKLPDGIAGLVRDASAAGVKLGLWVEPEMVNPKSRLYEQHPDWVVQQPNRKPYYFRNQLVLDLTNPKVQDYVFSVIDDIMTENPQVAFFKWDCNSPITNIFSPYEKTEQGNFYIDYVRGLYAVLERVKAKYPSLPMMLCSGGGGRMDFEALRYFTEFWCSDNTDPCERIYMQWSLSKFFPAKTMCSHVTNWNRRTSIKFRTDVSSMCKLGFDIDVSSLSADERAFIKDAVGNWSRLKPAILDGDAYRLLSPYTSNHCAINYVSKDKQHAVLFAYDLHPRYDEVRRAVCFKGLDPARRYTVREINLMPGSRSRFAFDGKTFSGEYLMKVGLDVLSAGEGQSHVLELF